MPGAPWKRSAIVWRTMTVSPHRRKRRRRPIGFDGEQPKQPLSFGNVSSSSVDIGMEKYRTSAVASTFLAARGALEYSARRGPMFDLSYTAEEEAFRAELRAWLAAHVPAERRP